MKVVFMGTPEFSVPILRALVENGYEVAGVFTQPDKPKGRGGRVQMTKPDQKDSKRGKTGHLASCLYDFPDRSSVLEH